MVVWRVAVVVLLVAAFVGAEPVVVVKEGEEDIIVYQQHETQPQNATSTSLCVKPGGDFEHVCVTVEDETGGEKVDGCFDIKNCSLSSAPWKLVTVQAKVGKGVVSTRFKVKYNLTYDGCVLTRGEDYKSGGIASLSVSAYGASQWLTSGSPEACPDTENPASGPLPTYVIVIIVVVVVVLVVVLGVLGVVFRKWLPGLN